MDPSINKGVIAGILGAAIGAYGWALLLGIVIKELLLMILPILFGLICVFGFLKLRRDFPQKRWALIGVAVVWLTLTNMILFNAFYTRIPDQLYHGENELLIALFSTNKAPFNPLIVNLLFGIVLMVGLVFILMDVIRMKR
jgi:glucan phosphoethanolaminetransferase (alkaline phosphatase superfamily)